MSRIPIGIWKPRPGETRDQFTARASREIRAIAQQKRATSPEPEWEKKNRDRILATPSETTEQFEETDG